MDSDFSFLGERIKREREKKKITQEKLAEMIDCSIAHISHVETGRTEPSLKLVIKIINSLQISSDLLLCDYLQQAEYVFENELADIMEECTETEIKFVVENAKENLRLFRKYNGNHI